MNEDDNINVDINNDDQAEFEQLFFNGEPVENEEIVEEPEDQLGEEGADLDPSATDEPEDNDDEDSEEEDEKPRSKRNRNSAQERINKLTADKREAERRETALLRRLDELEAAVKKETIEKAPLKKDDLPDGAPNFEAVGEDGEPVYALGEFDPKFIRDLTRFTIEQETKAAREQEAQEAQEKAIEGVKAQLQSEWVERLDQYEEEVPEIRENILHLTETFESLNPAYGEYLATTIMASEVGPQIMNYLSDNIGEAQKIVASGPAAATLALGRLEARFVTSNEKETKRNNKRVSDAPAPPENLNRGSKGQFAVRPDTDDQRAFEREFFKK